MTLGVPVLASNRGSLPWIVSDAGLLVDPEDVEGIADATAGLLTDRDQAERMGRAARARAREFVFTPEEFAARTSTLVESVVERR